MCITRFLGATFVFFLASHAATARGTTWYVDGAVPHSGDGRTWETAFAAIQEGMDAASDGDTVTVGPGTYVENIEFRGKNITLTSTDPLDSDIVAATIIDGKQSGPVVTFERTEDQSCALLGFTIRNGKAEYGGGICGGTRENPTDASIQNNVIVANLASRYGAGLAYCDGLISRNVIIQNNSEDGGGGLFRCGGVIERNTISSNTADGPSGGLAYCGGTIQDNLVCANSAGGLAYCDGTIQNNVISGNSGRGLYDCDGLIQNNVISGNSGGGLYGCDGLINSNTISENSAVVGGGLAHCDGTIRGNEISLNSASSSGGGLYCCDRIIQNNTVAHNNSADRGGGLYDCDGTVENNRIAWNNAGGLYECDGMIQNNRIFNNSSHRDIGGGLDRCDGSIQNNVIAGNSPGLHSCHGLIRDNTIVGNRVWYGPGILECTGTITNCVIWGNEGYAGSQLRESSEPTYCCIQDWAGEGEGNIAEDPRFLDPDGPDDDPETYEDNDYRLLPDSPCVDAGFNHLDLPAKDIAGMRRIMYGRTSLTVDMGAYEYYINELQPGPAADEATLTWSSIAGSTYVILYSEDLLIWILADAAVPSVGNQTTSWIDDGSKTGVPPTLAPRRFYRVLENP